MSGGNGFAALPYWEFEPAAVQNTSARWEKLPDDISIKLEVGAQLSR
jgi:hypothetical protein